MRVDILTDVDDEFNEYFPRNVTDGHTSLTQEQEESDQFILSWSSIAQWILGRKIDLFHCNQTQLPRRTNLHSVKVLYAQHTELHQYICSNNR